MCNCFDTVEKCLVEETGDPLATLNHTYIMPDFKRVPVVEATYRKKKKDGSFNKNVSTISISYPFCPFCGKKLEDK